MMALLTQTSICLCTPTKSAWTQPNVVLCKAFSSTLRGPALDLFANLSPFFIDYFDALMSSFTTYFKTSCLHDVTSLSLLNKRQEEGESLTVYIVRFRTVALKVKDLNSNSILHYMINNLQVGLFADEVCMNPPANMNVLRQGPLSS